MPQNCSAGWYFMRFSLRFFIYFWVYSFQMRHPSPSFLPPSKPPSQMYLFPQKKPLLSWKRPYSNFPTYAKPLSLKFNFPLPKAIPSLKLPWNLNPGWSMVPSSRTPSLQVPLKIVFWSMSRKCPLPYAFPFRKVPEYRPYSEIRIPLPTGTMALSVSCSSPSQQKLGVRMAYNFSPRQLTQCPFLCNFHLQPYSFSNLSIIYGPNSSTARFSFGLIVRRITEQGTSIRSSSIWLQGLDSGETTTIPQKFNFDVLVADALLTIAESSDPAGLRSFLFGVKLGQLTLFSFYMWECGSAESRSSSKRMGYSFSVLVMVTIYSVGFWTISRLSMQGFLQTLLSLPIAIQQIWMIDTS